MRPPPPSSPRSRLRLRSPRRATPTCRRGEAEAKAALEKSPRHGEYVDIKLPGGRHADPHLGRLSRAQGQGRRRHRHPRDLRPDRLDPRRRRPARRRRLHRRRAGPDLAARARTAAAPIRRRAATTSSSWCARSRPRRRPARLNAVRDYGTSSCRPPTARAPPSASAGAARRASPTPAAQPDARTPRSSTTAPRRRPRTSRRSRPRCSASTAATTRASTPPSSRPRPR